MITLEEMKTRLEGARFLTEQEFLNRLQNDLDSARADMQIKTSKTKQGCEKFYYYNMPAAFDIETTGDRQTKTAYMYQWQLCINGWCIEGRTWNDYFQLLHKVKDLMGLAGSMTRLVIYVYNLSYEAAFLMRRLDIRKVFATAKREPLYIETTDGFVYKDAEILSPGGLKHTAEGLTDFQLRKQSGDLDYTIQRNSKTPLTEKEEYYCISDVTTLTAYIYEQMMQYNGILRIPLTNTGRVRRYMEEHCLYKDSEHTANRHHVKNTKYITKIHNLTMQADEYRDCKKAFMGGFTHAGHLNSGKICSNCQSYDFSSSYPGRMNEFRYPMSKGTLHPYHSMKQYMEDVKRGYLIIALVEFTDLKDTPFPYEHYLSISKIIEGSGEGIKEDNGRLVSARRAAFWLTNVDMSIIRKTYTAKCRIIKAWRYEGGYLPAEYLKCVQHFYNQKTTLKGVKGKDADYKNFKGMNNSIYGMSVTDPVRTSITYEECENEPWEETDTTDPKKWKDYQDDEIKKYNKKKNRFDFYPWGVFITAWARWDLWQGILELKADYIYSDTDSVKYMHPERHEAFFKRHNGEIRARIQKQCITNGLTYQIPKTVKGIEKPLGEWDYDGSYKRFKTLGAKRYLYEDDSGIHLTISGVNKKTGAEYICRGWAYSLNGNKEYNSPFDKFKNGLLFPAGDSGKTASYYTDTPVSAYIEDPEHTVEEMHESSCVYIEEVAYRLGMTQTYIDYLESGSIGGQSIAKCFR